MEKGPSTYAEYWTSEESEFEHFDKHGEYMGFKSIEEYLKSAANFMNSNERGIQAFVSAKFNGSTYRFNPRTGEFGIISKEGKIVTYYKTTGRYFENQYNEHGIYWIS